MDYSDSDRKVPATKKRPNTEPDLLHLPGTTESNNYTPCAHSHWSQECFPDFTTIEEVVVSILNTKKGASDHMELLLKSGQLSIVVIFKAPRQIGGENSHVTDPGKPAGSHFIETKNRDSMPTADRLSKRGKAGGKASLGKP